MKSDRKWQQQQRLGTSFPFASQTAVDLIHIKVLLSSIPYLPIPTNLITPLFLAGRQWGPVCGEESTAQSIYRILCCEWYMASKGIVVAVTNPRNSFLNCNELNMDETARGEAASG